MGELRRLFKSKMTGKYSDHKCSIDEATNLAYDLDTKIVHYKFEGSYMSPYIGPNGKFCRFVAEGGKIEEIK